MPVNININNPETTPSLPTLSAKKNGLNTPLLEQIDSANTSPIEFTRNDPPWLPERMLEWLKKQWWHKARQPDSEKAPAPGGKMPLSQAMADEEAGRVRTVEEPHNCLAWKMGLLVLGMSASAFGAYAWLRLKNNDASRTSLLPGNENFPLSSEESPLFQALIANDNLTQAFSEKSAETITAATTRTFQRRNRAALCEGAAALERCENLRAKHSQQKPTILMIKDNNQSCRCPAAGIGVKNDKIINEPVKPDPQERLPEESKIKASPFVYVGEKTTEDILNEPEIARKVKKTWVPENKNKAEPETPVDDVKIEQLFDFSCIEARNDLSITDKIRAVGAALAKPVTSLAKEIQIIYSHNIAGKGCPQAEDAGEVQYLTEIVDYIVNNLIGLFPGMRVPLLLQTVVGPALQLIADDLEGKPVDVASMNELALQFESIMRPTLETLTPREQISLYNKPEGKMPAAGENVPGSPYEGIYSQRLSVHNRVPQVQAEGQQYKLQTLPGDVPFVIDNDRNFHFIRYDQIHHRWYFVAGDEASVYSEQAKQELNQYSMSLAHRSEESSFKLDKDSELLTFSTPGEPDITGVFIRGKFVPAQWEHINGERVAVTNLPGQAEKRILLYSGFGWTFERPSIKTDKYLKLLLEDNDTAIPLAIRHTAGNHITPINNAIGFSDSTIYGRVIKKDNRYYKVISAHNTKTDSEISKLIGFNDAEIEFDKGMFKLKKSADIPFALRNEIDIPGPNLPVSLKMERGTLDYLTQYAKTTATAPRYAMHNGLFRAANGEVIFIFQGRNYPVSKYENRVISIPRQQGESGPDIRLWQDEETWVRIRDERNKPFTEYEEAASCRRIRAPNQAGECSPVMIEMDLHKQLAKYIDKDLTTNYPPIPENLSKSDLIDIPVLYSDIKTMRHYFLYEGRYFDTEIVHAKDSKNPTGLPCLKITGKGNIFNHKKDIATIVIDKAENKYFIKSQQTFIAEKLNINKNVAGEYLENREYRDVAEIDTIEELVNEVQEARKIFFAKPRRHSGSGDHSLAAWARQQESAKKSLFSEHVIQDSAKYDIRFFTLDTDANLLNPFEQKAVEHVRAKLKYAKERILNTVVSATWFDGTSWPGIMEYFKGILPDSNAVKQLEADFTASLQRRLERMIRALDEKKIVLVTAHEQSERALTDRTQSVLAQEERLAGDACYMPAESDGRIFINIDKLDLDGTSASASLADPVTVIMHAASHTKGMSTDVITLEKTRGITPPVNDFIKQLTTQLEEQTLPPHQLNALIEVSKEYINNIRSYRRKPSSLLTSKGLAYLLQNDPGYRAHVLLNSSESVTALAQDMYYWINMSDNNLSTGWIDPWIQRFGIARGDLSATVQQLPVTTSKLELNSLPSFPLNYQSIHEVQGKKDIYYTLPDLDLLFKKGEQYYPVEFVGSSNKVIFVGKEGDVRQMYYYDPATGNIKPTKPEAHFNNLISYNRNLDVFESQNIETGIPSVLKFDEAKSTLIETGARQIVPMLNNVMKVEFEKFDLFTIGKNMQEVYLAAHAARQLTLKRQPIPDNVNLKFYTPKGKVLRGHVDDLLELVKNKLPVIETKPGGSLTESYDISYDADSQINYHQLAEGSGKNLIRIKPDASATSTEIMQAVSKLFINKDIDLHMYICRSC